MTAVTPKTQKGFPLPDDDNPKKKKIKGGKELRTQYNTYSGIINDEGKSIDNPTEREAVTTMAKYMQKNQSDQSSNPSNIYRKKYSHITQAYKKKPSTTA